MKTIAIEEHFSAPMQVANSSLTEFRKLFLASRSEYLGHNIVDELADLGERRLQSMDAVGVDIAVYRSPLPVRKPSKHGRRSRPRATAMTCFTKQLSGIRRALRASPRCRQPIPTLPRTNSIEP